ncbi:MAG TPA: peptidase, partial [Bacteroidales bacterium]|nr:peptidase [Bacteroidales bacterium]
MKFKNSILLLISLLLFTGNLYAQELYDRTDDQYKESCTSIMVASGASSDGSVMIGHTCDANYRTWLTMEPRKRFSLGDMEPVYEGMMHNEEPWDMR